MRIKRSFAAKVITDPVEACQRMVYGPCGALEACAEVTGVSHQTLSKQLNEVDGNTLSLRKAAALESFLDTDALAECFAARRGGVFVKLHSDMLAPPELLQGFAKMIAAFAEASKDFSAAVADGRITPAELDRFERHWRDTCVAGEQLVRVARHRVVEEV